VTSTLSTSAGAIIAALITLGVGYLLGIRQRRLERIQERRENAVADIFGALMSNYRAYGKWADTGKDPEKEQLADDSYHYTGSIWLTEDTREMIKKYAIKSRNFYESLSEEMDHRGELLDGTKAMVLLNENLGTALEKVEDKLRSEMDISRRAWWRRALFPVKEGPIRKVL